MQITAPGCLLQERPCRPPGTLHRQHPCPGPLLAIPALHIYGSITYSALPGCSSEKLTPCKYFSVLRMWCCIRWQVLLRERCRGRMRVKDACAETRAEGVAPTAAGRCVPSAGFPVCEGGVEGSVCKCY